MRRIIRYPRDPDLDQNAIFVSTTWPRPRPEKQANNTYATAIAANQRHGLQ
jgi:hypothetical protein